MKLLLYTALIILLSDILQPINLSAQQTNESIEQTSLTDVAANDSTSMLKEESYDHLNEDPLIEVTASRDLLSIVFHGRVVSRDPLKCRKALYQAFKEVERLDKLTNPMKESSEISKINKSAGKNLIKVEPEIYELLRLAKDYSIRYRKLIDPTAGVMKRFWMNGIANKLIKADQDTIESLKFIVDSELLQLYPEQSSVYLPIEGMSIDLDCILVGHAVDKAISLIKANGINNFYLRSGNNCYSSGVMADSLSWKIGILDPKDKNKIIAEFHGTDEAIATSSILENQFTIDDKKYHSIIDPLSGKPGNKCLSVTVWAPTMTEAIIYSRYLFLLGADKFLQDLKASQSVADAVAIEEADALKQGVISGKIKYFMIDNSGDIYHSDNLIEQNQLTVKNK